MIKALLFCHSGFSDENANGITMKKLLSAFPAEAKAEFYCDVQPPDYTAAHNYFRVTDSQMLKAFLFRKSRHIYRYDPAEPAAAQASCAKKNAPRRIPGWLKKHKYNFLLKWLREWLWKFSPWGHKALKAWIDDQAADVLVYMVGESLFMDDLVLKTAKRTGRPLVLYNSEAYRIIDLNTRRGLERAYYKRTHRRYEKLNRAASLVIFNSEMLRQEYAKRYAPAGETLVAYNSADCTQPEYRAGDSMNITYFGNLGVGRVPSLVQVADILRQLPGSPLLDVYGNAQQADQERFEAHSNIRYHGFVSAGELEKIVEKSDLLLHAESFAPEILPKLRYAFSTKIAQCLCAGRCFVSYAPEDMASTQYLRSQGMAVAHDPAALQALLRSLVTSSDLRRENACQALALGKKNHKKETTAQWVREKIGEICHEKAACEYDRKAPQQGAQSTRKN